MSLNRLTAFRILILFMATATAVPLQTARADTAPKPSMQFQFVYGISPAPTIVSGIQFECHMPDCSDAQPLMVAGPQRFSCGGVGCSSMAYDYSEYHFLSIVFSDGVTRQSNVFGKKYFDALYQVTVRENDLVVKERRGSGAPFTFSILANPLGCGILLLVLLLPGVLLLILAIRASEFQQARGLYIAAWLVSLPALAVFLLEPSMVQGLLFTLAVEMALAAGYAIWRKRPLALLLTIVWMMNLITHSLLSLGIGELFYLLGAGIVWTLASELVIWLVEAGILAIALRKQIRFREALLLSLVLNVASFGIGMLLAF
jgi:hypothetical protein